LIGQRSALDFRRQDDCIFWSVARSGYNNNKGVPHLDPVGPRRLRGNRAPGLGTRESDRPPVCWVVGRECGGVRPSVEEHSDSATLNWAVREVEEPPPVVNTDD
jgi:hypothetical protein